MNSQQWSPITSKGSYKLTIQSSRMIWNLKLSSLQGIKVHSWTSGLKLRKKVRILTIWDICLNNQIIRTLIILKVHLRFKLPLRLDNFNRKSISKKIEIWLNLTNIQSNHHMIFHKLQISKSILLKLMMKLRNRSIKLQQSFMIHRNRWLMNWILMPASKCKSMDSYKLITKLKINNLLVNYTKITIQY